MDKTKILVVDDALFMRKLLGNTLKDIGYSNIVFAQDGMKPLTKPGKYSPRL